MATYTKLSINTTEEQGEILAAYLADFPFDSFDYADGLFNAYAQQNALDESLAEIEQMLEEEGFVDYFFEEIEAQNWNSVWESNFEEVEVKDKVLIRAPFHEPRPNYSGLEVIIQPKMSFGTGHHATTRLMVEMILNSEVEGKRILDMGSGTGVLAIVAAKFGAERVDAVDIDDWAYENCIENIAQNGVADRIVPILGDASAIEGKQYDFILANINRNILIADMPRYAATLRAGGELYMSGILERDVEDVRLRAAEFGIEMDGARFRNGWAVMRCIKK
jgi:ribosomal protein L11 methyltransferase